MKILEYKRYLKHLFFTDSTFMIRLPSDMDYDTLCNKAFSMNLHENFLHEKFTLQ
jgi:hypothetical protein